MPHSPSSLAVCTYPMSPLTSSLVCLLIPSSSSLLPFSPGFTVTASPARFSLVSLRCPRLLLVLLSGFIFCNCPPFPNLPHLHDILFYCSHLLAFLVVLALILFWPSCHSFLLFISFSFLSRPRPYAALVFFPVLLFLHHLCSYSPCWTRPFVALAASHSCHASRCAAS